MCVYATMGGLCFALLGFSYFVEANLIFSPLVKFCIDYNTDGSKMCKDEGWVGGNSGFPRPRADHEVLWLPWSVHRAANGFPINFNHLLSPLGRIDVHSFLIQCKRIGLIANPKLKLCK